MSHSLAHRGPDDAGLVLLDPGPGGARAFPPGVPSPDWSARAGLVHRRLSILDLSPLGHQPCADPSGRYWMSYNGEVYNYLELREDLKAHGHVFHSGTDTEVLLKGFLQWGSDCFRRFNGMWALAIYDRETGVLVLSRDRFGKKPLYFTRANGALVFASEIKALLACPAVEARPNLRKIAAYAGGHYRLVDGAPDSFFEGISQVPPATVLTIDQQGDIRSERYWSLPVGATRSDSEATLIEEYRGLLEDAVRLRLRSDVPVGLLMSGGLDSTAIAAMALRIQPAIRAFSGVTGEGYFDESDHVRAMMAHTGISVDFVRPPAEDVWRTLKEMMSFHDEPICTVAWYSLYLLTREIARTGLKVVLTGHGGDELLAGYWDHYHYRFFDLRRQGLDDGPEVAAWRAQHGRDPVELERERDRIEAAHHRPDVERARFFPHRDALAPALAAAIAPTGPEWQAEEELTRRLARELLFETVPASLRAEDRNMMAFSLENRVPFLDYRLVEFCFSLPSSLKIRGGLGKWIHRKALAGLLPESILWRKDKTGHNAPLDVWLRTSLRARMEGLLADDHAVNRGVYRPGVLTSLFRAHLAGENHAMFFWQYMNLRLWADRFEPVASALAAMAT